MIGDFIKQPSGYTAFIPHSFPPEGIFEFSTKIYQKLSEAERLLGKLDGLSSRLPNLDFFLSMYILKDATYSSQIEWTRATMMDAIELSAGINEKNTDADDILHYIDALNYSIKRLSEFPFSLRFIREIHKKLMIHARSSHFADPGEFRKSQNWIGGTTPENAHFVPPPVDHLGRALDDIENFIHATEYIPLLQVGILHAQFETVHPFLDGNGRTGRILITLFLYSRAMLEQPVLFLSSYFKKHQQVYYNKLNAYHNGRVEEWIDFFLDGIIETARESIEISKKIDSLREEDMQKIQSLGKREAGSGVQLLNYLFSEPLVTTTTVSKALWFSRVWAQKTIDRFIDLNILSAYDQTEKYGKRYFYRRYIDIFNN
jgi:Fic family protein